MNELDSTEQRGAHFLTTHWSVVLEAGGSRDGEHALESLCRAYWYPLYAFVRRRGFAPAEAQDLTQEFFARLLERQTLQTADPEKGRFRGFLVAAMRHFLSNQWRDLNRMKRGGGSQFLSWDELNPEERYLLEPESEASAETVYDRSWARTVAAEALNQVRKEMEREGNSARFEALRAYLESDDSPQAYAQTALRLKLSESAVKSAIHRLRRRYAEVIRESIAHTVQSPDQIEGEIRHLIDLLAA